MFLKIIYFKKNILIFYVSCYHLSSILISFWYLPVLYANLPNFYIFFALALDESVILNVLQFPI